MKRVILSLFILIFIKTAVAQLSSPVLIEPPKQEYTVSLNITLNWADVTGADYYEIQISVLSDFSDINSTTYTPDNTSAYTVPNGTLANFTHYYWRIRAINSTETGPWSEVWDFTTIGTPSEEIGVLQSDITDLANQNKLPANQAEILINRLDKAIQRLENNQNNLALVNMFIFKVRVLALVISNHLAASDGEKLNAHADIIIDLILEDNPHGLAEEPGILNKFSLSQNYPNPFNPVTTIEFTIPEKSFVTLKVYDIQGREITTLVNDERNPGLYIVNWNAAGYSSGVYFYRITAGNYMETKRMILTK